jgi:hypothetical protein
MSAEDTRRVVTRPLDAIPADELKSYHSIIEERLGITCTEDEPDPVIDLKDIAELGGLAPGTPGQMRQRSKDGKGRILFPAEAEGIGTRWPDKPLFRAVTAVIPYLEATGNWPPGAGARPSTRGPRRRDEAA